MKIASQTPAELVISDSTKVIGGIFAGAAAQRVEAIEAQEGTGG